MVFGLWRIVFCLFGLVAVVVCFLAYACVGCSVRCADRFSGFVRWFGCFVVGWVLCLIVLWRVVGWFYGWWFGCLDFSLQLCDLLLILGSSFLMRCAIWWIAVVLLDVGGW